jgi:nicotinamide mononucleotide transporter
MFDVLIEVGKVQITWLEAAAFVLALSCVICNVLEIHWGWPLAIISSGLYFVLFYRSKLYGDAGIQIYFVLASFWGWWQWVRHKPEVSNKPHANPAPAALLRVTRLSRRGLVGLGITWLVLWGMMGAMLSRFTDSDVPWADAFPTAGSLIGQILLGRKVLENWAVWQVVNLAMVALLAYKALWLTMVLYLVFLVMAVLGWRRWSQVSA